MKANLSVQQIKSTVEFLGKHVEPEISDALKHTENPTYVTNTLDAMASSGKAMVDTVRLELLKKYESVVELFESGKGFEEYAVNGKNIERDIKILKKPGQLIDNYVPVFRTNEDALKSMQTGDVFQIKGNPTVSIKNKLGEAESLSMDRKTYFKLFPPLERFMGFQPKHFGNCYEITALNTVMERPETRENLLRCIDTVSKKDMVRIKFPEKTLPKGIELPKNGIEFSPSEIQRIGEDFYINGCEGMKYVEHAFGKVYEQVFLKDNAQKLKQQGLTKKDLSKEIKLDEVTRNVPLQTHLRESGDAVVPWRILGFEKNETVEMGDFSCNQRGDKTLIGDRKWLEHFKTSPQNNETKFIDLLDSPKFFEEHFVEAYVGGNEVLPGMEKWHSYRLAAIFDKDGNIEAYALKNPHCTTDKLLDYEMLIDTIDSISFASIK